MNWAVDKSGLVSLYPCVSQRLLSGRLVISWLQGGGGGREGVNIDARKVRWRVVRYSWLLTPLDSGQVNRNKYLVKTLLQLECI